MKTEAIIIQQTGGPEADIAVTAVMETVETAAAAAACVEPPKPTAPLNGHIDWATAFR